MTVEDADDPPTFSRPPPPVGVVLPSLRTPSFSVADVAPLDGGDASAEEDEGPPTDVSGPPTFSLAPGPRKEVDLVTLVNAAPPHERLTARVVTADATHLFVLAEGELVARRISRSACFEHPVGGGWSTWRLSGADRERWRVEVEAVPGDGSA